MTYGCCPQPEKKWKTFSLQWGKGYDSWKFRDIQAKCEHRQNVLGESFLDKVAPPEAWRETMGRDFNHRGSNPGVGLTMEKPETEILFACALNMEVMCHIWVFALFTLSTPSTQPARLWNTTSGFHSAKSYQCCFPGICSWRYARFCPV